MSNHDRRWRRRTILAAPAASAAVMAAAQQQGAGPRVLITSASHPLAFTLASALGKDHRVRLTDRQPVSSRFEFVRSALDNPQETAALVQGVDAIVHVAESSPGDDDRQTLDWLTRGTYHLLEAASKARVPKAVFLSTLELMTAYDANYTVSESWRPRPTTDARVLGKYLGEVVCREFARDRKIRAMTLRLGKVVKFAGTAGQPFDPLWVDEEDVAHAVARAIAVTPRDNAQGVGSWWAAIHIGSESAKARFSVSGAKYALNYQPKVKW
jgi:uronate dehydrogenase